jgi:hypothetical protein
MKPYSFWVHSEEVVLNFVRLSVCISSCSCHPVRKHSFPYVLYVDYFLPVRLDKHHVTISCIMNMSFFGSSQLLRLLQFVI